VSIKSLPFETAKTLVNCFVISRIDYCNSLLAGMPRYALDRLQRVMNAAARMLSGAGKYSPGLKVRGGGLSPPALSSAHPAQGDWCGRLREGIRERGKNVRGSPPAFSNYFKHWYSHISGFIRDHLHWLPVPQRVRFKLCLTMYKVMHGLAPAYLSELCERANADIRTRSPDRGDLVMQRTKTKFGQRVFVVAGPAAWNSLHS